MPNRTKRRALIGIAVSVSLEGCLPELGVASGRRVSRRALIPHANQHGTMVKTLAEQMED